jgi:CelD/BcsL family acetyltransferase involved in cellulose biosynthesis
VESPVAGGRGTGTAARLTRCDLSRFEVIAPQWERLRRRGGGPFLTAAWLASWWRAFAPGEELALVLEADDGTLLAGGCFLDRGRALDAAVNAHSNDWEVVARDAEAESRFWQAVAALGHRSIVLQPLSGESAALRPREALRRAGYRLVEEPLEPSPWLELPRSFDELLAARSRNLRSQVGRRRRRLESEGELTLRAVRGGPTLERDLDAFFALEAAGWKGGKGTAIAADPRLLDLYRGFAERASSEGWLRLFMLELDGRLVAAEYGSVFEDCGYVLKSAFDEDLAHFRPGFVLMVDVLGVCIDEGLGRYDFLGGPDDYKVRWADGLRARTALRAFRGSGGMPAYVWRKRLRPGMKTARDLARDRVVAVRQRASRRRRAGRTG